MENATKALLIAAAVLIVIGVIAVSLKISNAGGNVGGQAETMANSLDVQSFNSQFSVYNGKISGTQLRTLVVLVNNAKSSKTIDFATTSDTTAVRFVNSTTKSIDANSDDIKDADKYNIVFAYDTNGYINKITVTK